MLLIVLFCLLLLCYCKSNENYQSIVDDVLTNGEWIRLEGRAYNYTIQDFPYSHYKWNTRKIYVWSNGSCSASPLNYGQFYKWQSSSPSALNIDFSVPNLYKQMIYKQLHGKQLLIVGDSISNAFHITLLHMLWDENESKSLPTYAIDWLLHDKVVKMTYENYSFNLTYVRSFYLHPAPLLNHTIHNHNATFDPSNEFSWTQFLTPNTILLLNKGAHFVAEDDYCKTLKITFDAILANHHQLISNKSLLVIFRDTHFALHDYVLNFNREPLKYFNYTEHYTAKELEYGWDRFDIENHLARKLISDEYKWVTYMNVSGSTKLRLDSRSDYMHYCIPGPIDHWIQKLIETLNIII